MDPNSKNLLLAGVSEDPCFYQPGDPPPSVYCRYSPYIGNTWWMATCKEWADCTGFDY